MTKHTATYTFETTDPVIAAAVAEIFTNIQRNEEIEEFSVKRSTFGDGVCISTQCTRLVAYFLNAEIVEAQRRVERFGTTMIG